MATLSEFRGIHHGEAMVVCGLGSSIKTFAGPERFYTIGVNDIGRAFTPDYMFCMDGPKTFPPDRLAYIRGSGARYIFSDHDLGVRNENVVKAPVKVATAPRFDDPNALYLIGRPSTSPFMAICLAVHMGAKAIGLIGVDFTDGHFFANDGTHKLTNQLPGIDRRYYLLGKALLDRGIKIFNLSEQSRLRAYPRLTVDQFYRLQLSGRTRSWTRPVRSVYLHAAAPLGPERLKNAQELARLINSETTVSCRVIAPASVDVPPEAAPGSLNEIKQHMHAADSILIDCNTVALPAVATGSQPFLDQWSSELRPLLFGRPTAFARDGGQRALTLRVIVSQEWATASEVAETVRRLWRDTARTDDILVVGRHGASREMPAWLRGTGTIRYTEQMAGESFIAARNRAAAHSAHDILVFTDANVQTPAEWVDLLLSGFADKRVAAVGPAIVDMYDPQFKSYGMNFADAELSTAWLPRPGPEDAPFAVPLVPGAFLAIRRSAFEQLGGFDAGMHNTGADDIELCFRLWTMGFQCVVAPLLEVKWMNPFAAGAIRTGDYWADLLHNLLRFAQVHLGPERLGAFVAQAAAHPEFASARDTLLINNSTPRKLQVRKSRRYSDDWFFERFSNGPA